MPRLDKSVFRVEKCTYFWCADVIVCISPKKNFLNWYLCTSLDVIFWNIKHMVAQTHPLNNVSCKAHSNPIWHIILYQALCWICLMPIMPICKCQYRAVSVWHQTKKKKKPSKITMKNKTKWERDTICGTSILFCSTQNTPALLWQHIRYEITHFSFSATYFFYFLVSFGFR